MNPQEDPNEFPKSQMLQVATVFISAVAAVGSLVALLIFIKPYGYLPETVSRIEHNLEDVQSVNKEQDNKMAIIVGEESTIKQNLSRATQLSEDTNEKATHIQQVLDNIIYHNQK